MQALVTHVLGARPNFMKAAPLIRALADLGVAQMLIHTGQHYDSIPGSTTTRGCRTCSSPTWGCRSRT